MCRWLVIKTECLYYAYKLHCAAVAYFSFSFLTCGGGGCVATTGKVWSQELATALGVGVPRRRSGISGPGNCNIVRNALHNKPVTEKWRVKGDARKYTGADTLQNIIKMTELGGWGMYSAQEKRNSYKILVVNPEGKRPLERHRHRWEDSIQTSLKGIGWGGGLESWLTIGTGGGLFWTLWWTFACHITREISWPHE
jgi:hypothetical protein